MTLAEILVRLGLEDNLSAALDNVGNKLTSFGAGALDVGAKLSIGLTTPLLAFATAAVKTAADMESLQLGLKSIETAADPAAKQFERLQEVAKLPGLSLEQAVRASINLQSAGFSAQQAERAIRNVGNALALVGKGSADLNPVLIQLEQMSNKSKVVAGDLKPIIERVPQIGKAIREAFHTTDTEAIQKMGVSTATMVEFIQISLEKLNRAGDGTKNKFENFADAMDQAMTRVGKAMLPTVDVAMNLLLPAMDSASKAFEGLDTGTKNAIVGLGAFAIALGPVLFYAGGAASVIGSVLKVIALLAPEANIAAIAIGALRTAVVFLGEAAVIGAAMYAAWNIGQWAYNHIPGVKALVGALRKIPGVSAVGDAAADAWTWAEKMDGASPDAGDGGLGKGNSALEALAGAKKIDISALMAQFKDGKLTLEQYNTKLNEAIRLHQSMGVSAASLGPEIQRLEAVLKQHGITMTQGNLSSQQYVESLRKMVAGFKAAAGDGGKAANEFEQAIKQAFSLAGVKDESFEIEKTENAMKTLEKAYAEGKITTDSFTAAHTALESRLDMLREGFDSTSARAKAYGDAIAQINKMDAFINFSNNPLSGAPNIGGDGKPVAAVPATIGDVFKDGMSQAVGATAEFDRALKTLGITHHTTAAQMKQAWDEVRDSSIASSREKLEAERAYLKAVSAETGQLTKEQQARLKEIDIALDGQAKKVSVLWQDVSREVSKAFDHMARGMAQSIVEWKGFGETLKSVFKDFAEGILEIMFQQLLNPLKKGITDMLLGDGKSGGGLLGGLGGLFGGGSKGGGIFSALGGGIPSAASSIGTGDIFDVALGGGGAGGGGGLFSGLLGGLTSFANPLSLITGGIGAIGSVIGAIGSMRQEGTLNAIEESTRYVKGYMRDNIIPDEQVWWPRLGDIEMILHDDFSQKLTQMRDDIHTVAYPPPGSANAPIMVSGNLVLGDGDIERFADKLVGILKARGVYPQGK